MQTVHIRFNNGAHYTVPADIVVYDYALKQAADVEVSRRPTVFREAVKSLDRNSVEITQWARRHMSWFKLEPFATLVEVTKTTYSDDDLQEARVTLDFGDA